MVKTRGHRVELDKVEAALNSHPDVAGTSEVVQHAAGKIPQYALPTSLDIIAEFPRPSSGKIERKALAKRPR
jgi:acyl-coenzyme A synthetase/AMP-(fatty) acid ligase